MIVVGWVFLIVCGFLPSLYAQEMAGQGWGAPSPRQQRSTSAIFVTGREGDYGSSRLSPKGEISAPVRHPIQDESSPPFPVLMPKIIAYPRKAVRKGWEGQVVVAAEILPDGSVGRTELAKTSGHEVLDCAALNAIKTWKFSEASLEEDVIPQYVDIPVMFKIQSEE